MTTEASMEARFEKPGIREERGYFVWKPLSTAILFKLTPTSKFPRTANGRLIFSPTESA